VDAVNFGSADVAIFCGRATQLVDGADASRITIGAADQQQEDTQPAYV